MPGYLICGFMAVIASTCHVTRTCRTETRSNPAFLGSKSRDPGNWSQARVVASCAELASAATGSVVQKFCSANSKQCLHRWCRSQSCPENSLPVTSVWVFSGCWGTFAPVRGCLLTEPCVCLAFRFNPETGKLEMSYSRFKSRSLSPLGAYVLKVTRPLRPP